MSYDFDSPRLKFGHTIADSFHAYGDRFRVVNSEASGQTNPGALLADIALNRVKSDAALRLPHGMGWPELEEVREDLRTPDAERFISADQARALADIGHQVLEFDARGQIEPPLDSLIFQPHEAKAISYLLAEVDASGM